MKNSNDEENEKLRKLNEEKKREIEKEFGPSIWGKPEGSDLPPEIESQFLDHIMAFEKSHKESKRVSVFDYLGKPIFKKVDTLNDEEIHKELNRLNVLMQKNEVRLDTICEVPERELYRFITEELLFEDMDDMRIPGMNCCFIYEEYYPNHEHDIRNHSSEFMSSYLDKSSEFFKNLLTSDAEKLEWHQHFRNAFNSFDLTSFEITDLNFDKEKANVKFKCNINAKVEGANELFTFSGAGEMQLKYEWDYWSIDSITLPKSKVV